LSKVADKVEVIPILEAIEHLDDPIRSTLREKFPPNIGGLPTSFLELGGLPPNINPRKYPPNILVGLDASNIGGESTNVKSATYGH